MSDQHLDDAALADEATQQVVGSSYFKAARVRAQETIGDADRLFEVAAAAARSTAIGSRPFAGSLDEFRTLIRFVVSIARGTYQAADTDDVLDVVAALIYVESPVDVIPDHTPMVGFLDDAAVTGWVLEKARGELNHFRAWELAL